MDKFEMLMNEAWPEKMKGEMLAKYTPVKTFAIVQPTKSRYLCLRTISILNLVLVGLFLVAISMTIHIQLNQPIVDFFHAPIQTLKHRIQNIEEDAAIKLEHRLNIGLIVNGDPAKASEAKFQVQLRQIDYENGVDSFCGGTLITSNTVLTAAHCFDPELSVTTLSIRYGTHSSDSSPYPDVGVRSAIRHPFYSKKFARNDIAIIKLRNRVKPSENVAIARLDFWTLPGVEDVQIYGFGLTNGTNTEISQNLQKATLTTMTVGECNKVLQSADYPNDSGKLCALSPRQISCQGDSGGGLFNSDGRLVGITSLVESGCNPAGVAIFTRLAPHYLFVSMHSGRYKW